MSQPDPSLSASTPPSDPTSPDNLVQALKERDALIQKLLREQEYAIRARQLTKTGYWSWLVQEDRVQWSEEVYQIFGISPDQPANLATTANAIHPSSLSAWEQAVQATLEHDVPFSIEAQLVSENAQGERWIRGNGSLVRDAEGRPVEMYGTVTDISEYANERKQSRLLEQQLGEATELLGFGYFCFDEDSGAILSHNHTFTALMEELDVAEAHWETLQRRFSDSKDSLHEALAQAKLTNSPQRTRLSVKLAGALRWFELGCTASKSSGSLIQAYLREITDEVHREEDQEQALLLQQLTVQAGGFGFQQFNLETQRYEVFDQRMKELYGLEQHEGLPSFAQTSARIHPQDVPRMKSAIRRSLLSTEPITIEYRVGDGSQWRWMQGIGLRRQIEQQQHLLGLVWDIHDRKTLELERERTLHLRKLSNQAAKLTYWSWSPATGDLEWDEDSYELFEVPPGDPISFELFLSRVAPEDRHLFFEEDGSPRQSYPPSLEFWLLLPSGRRCRLRNHYLPVQLGEDWLVLGTGQDVTQEFEAAQQREHLLRLSALGESSATLAHELKSPLAALQLLAQTIGRVLHTPERAQQQLDKLQAVAVKLQQRLQNMQDFAKLSGKEEAGTHSLQSIWGNVLLICDHSLRQAGVQLQAHIPADPISLWCWPSLLEQLLINLINNARDAMAQSERKLLLVELSADEHQITLKVQDSGCGLEEETRQRLFDKFFTTKAEGLGLGMTVVETAVRQHQGHLEIQSTLGQGTTFLVTIPREPSSEKALPQA